MTIVYDTPIEVTEKQYGILMSGFQGIVAGREEGNKFFIKVMLMKYSKLIHKLLES